MRRTIDRQLPARIRRRSLARRLQRLPDPFGYRHPLTLGDPAYLLELLVIEQDLQALSHAMSICRSFRGVKQALPS